MHLKTLTALALTITTVLTLAGVTPSFALRQYRCNGRVQYRPCESDDGLAAASAASPSVRRGRARWTPARPGNRMEPRVFEDTFEKAGEHEGIWRGQVAGDGLIELKLYIYRRGRLDTQRYIGAVELHGETTFFAFKTTLPEGNNWTWVIKARAG